MLCTLPRFAPQYSNTPTLHHSTTFASNISTIFAAANTNNFKMEETRTDLSKILSISGKPGLYKMVAQVKTGVVVESLIDGKRFQAFSHDKISSLREISIFTNTEDVSLQEVMKTIAEKTNKGKAPDPKTGNQELKYFFETILPDYDKDRVYVSHLKKIFTWYNLLHEKDMLDFVEEEAPETTDVLDSSESTESPSEEAGESSNQ
jgi:hypothetical protein